jgi:hypothetical protein
MKVARIEAIPVSYPEPNDFDVEGWVYPPTGPGLGVEVIEEIVEGFRSEKVLARAK